MGVILLRKRITSPLLVASFSIVRLLYRTLLLLSHGMCSGKYDTAFS